MKTVLLIFFIFLASCTIPPVASKKPPIKFPRFIEVIEADGYKVEVWERKDGTRYMKFGDKTMDFYK